MRHLFRRSLPIAAVAALALWASAGAGTPTGYIHGSANPGAQIILIRLDSGAVMGIVAAADGSYRSDDLAPGRYRIAEKGNYHAPRELTVVAGKASEVDLSPPSSK